MSQATNYNNSLNEFEKSREAYIARMSEKLMGQNKDFTAKSTNISAAQLGDKVLKYNQLAMANGIQNQLQSIKTAFGQTSLTYPGAFDRAINFEQAYKYGHSYGL